LEQGKGGIVSKLSDLKAHIHTLGEIKSILNAMKNLSIVEMTKVSRLLATHGKVAATIQEGLADFEFFYGPPQSNPGEKSLLCVLIGSERGFCGGFNEQIAAHFEKAAAGFKNVRTLVMGRKLAMKFEGDPRLAGTMDGPSAAEEIPATISSLCERLKAYSEFRWLVIYNDGGEAQLETLETYPLEARNQDSPVVFPFPPLLYQTPAQIYPLLLEQHLFAALYSLFYLSFLAENRERLRHMDGALGKIEKDWSRMTLRANALRQEEITEELEIILMSPAGENV
jgi:F-type H+-transporting ATPase subunit gamma